MIRSAGIICKPLKDVVAAMVPGLVVWLQQHNVEVLVDEETAACADCHVRALPRPDLADKIDLLIVLGGDGTLLSAARALNGHQVPILAVNLGGLGFLTSVTREELYPVLERVLEGKHKTSQRMMLNAQIIRNGSPAEQQVALNDAVINKAALARMLDFDVYVDGSQIGRYRADGLIVATPTGSTAYSLAAGGPILHPHLDAFVITPICPHMLTNRPLVIPDTSRVEIDIAAAEEPVYLTLDGQVGFQLQAEDRVGISKSESRVYFVQSPQKTYYEVLRSKLRWGER
jgi:NAD+ kinase